MFFNLNLLNFLAFIDLKLYDNLVDIGSVLIRFIEIFILDNLNVVSQIEWLKERLILDRMHSLLVKTSPPDISEFLRTFFDATLVEKSSCVLTCDVIGEMALLMIALLTIFTLVLSLAVHAFHMTVEGVFVLQRLIANGAVEALLFAVLSKIKSYLV